jgi:phytoene dehydrogenase-like protein
MLALIQSLPEGLNQPQTLLADTGLFSKDKVDASQAAKIISLIAVGREEHHPHWRERFEEPAELPEPANRVEQMKHALKTKAGRAVYALRKQTLELVFGITKSVMELREPDSKTLLLRVLRFHRRFRRLQAEFLNSLQEWLFLRIERGAARQHRIESSIHRRLALNRPSLCRRHIVIRHRIG